MCRYCNTGTKLWAKNQLETISVRCSMVFFTHCTSHNFTPSTWPYMVMYLSFSYFTVNEWYSRTKRVKIYANRMWCISSNQTVRSVNIYLHMSYLWIYISDCELWIVLRIDYGAKWIFRRWWCWCSTNSEEKKNHSKIQFVKNYYTIQYIYINLLLMHS